MNPWQRNVRDFQKAIGRHSIEKHPPDEATRSLRARLLIEECQETVEALRADDTLEVIDGLTDVMYIVFGTAENYQIDLEPFWNETHRANMEKFPGGVVTINEFGKVKKPEGWRGPDHARVLKDITANPLKLAIANEARAFQVYCDAKEERRRIQEAELKKVSVRPSI